MKKSIIFIISLLALVSSSFASDREEMEMLSKAKISLVDAIKIAEDNLKGKALSASIDDDAFTPEYEISIVKDGKIFDVKVDGVNSKVLGFKEDIDD